MNSEQIGLARIHAYLAFCKRPWIFKSWKASFTNFGVLTPLETNLIQMENSWPDIDENQDIEQWVKWANDRLEKLIFCLDDLDALIDCVWYCWNCWEVFRE